MIAAKDKEFTATVMEVINGDALVVKLPNNTHKKIFLASIRPPREKLEKFIVILYLIFFMYNNN